MTTPAVSSTGRLRMADLDLDLDQRRLTRGDDELKLSKLNFRLLEVLATAAPALVTKDELADHVWDGRLVSPETIAQRIKLLRKVLGDDAHAPRYIEVVRGQGYRWLPRVRFPAQISSHGTTFSGNPDAPIGIDLNLPQQPSVVVLPFDAIGASEEDNQAFAEGLTHDVITGIGRARSLFVVARGTAFMFKGSRQDVREVSRKLGVRYVLQGSISFSGPRVRVNAALADGVSGAELWAERMTGKIADVFEFQEEISNVVVGSIEPQIEFAEQERAKLLPPGSLDAWSAYHRGWWHLNSFAPGCFDKAEHYFLEAEKLDPVFARTQAGLSCVHWVRGFLEVTEDREASVAQCLERGQKSVELDRRDPLAYWALGRACHLNKDFERSIEALQTANALNPSFAIGQFAQAFAMMHVGDNEKSNEILESARRLSPYDPMSYAILGVQSVNHAMLGRFDAAADLSVRGAKLMAWACQMFPVIAAYCNALAGREDTARSFFERLQNERPGYSKQDYLRAFPHQVGSDLEKIDSAFSALERLH